MKIFEAYLQDLQSIPLNELTEHSKRSALEILFKNISQQINDKIRVLQEPRRKLNYGSPDFLIYTEHSIIGYVENKKIGENLNKTLKTAQIKKYRELSDNILLTNYTEFVWIKKEVIESLRICEARDLENPNFKLDKNKVQKVNDLIQKFFSQAPIGLASSKDLAVALAMRAKNLKIYLFDELKRQEKEEQLGRLFGLFRTFKTNVSDDLKLVEFADAFAQMLVYGLFLAKLNADTQKITLRNAETFIPQSFQLIRELVSFFDELEKDNYKETRWIIEECISIMNNLELDQIQQSLSFSKSDADSLETDPYIYFYEDFLAAYDSSLRKSNGVYYTPPQVVFFMVSAINQILIDDFGIAKGFAANNDVRVLDFATGTGTFLSEIFKQVLEKTPQANLKNIIKEHLLKNMYGFEYLIAPYTIAHLKLSQLLKEYDYELTAKERLQVFLSNTLEPPYAKQNLFLPFLSQEGELAKQVKENPALVITGNPPYSISSSNKSAMILDLLQEYKKGLQERKINLDDDYIKFIRFAHEKIATYGQGVVAVITNNSFLDGITHRRMRESILEDFDKVYIVNLHGNSLKKEGDQNVFDIRVGVAISIFVKTPKPLKKKEFYYYSTKDNHLIKRQEKYDFLTSSPLKEVNFEVFKPQKPNFWFVKKDLTHQKEYDTFHSVKSIFNLFHSGIQTGRDNLIIDFDKKVLFKRVKDILQSDDENKIREKYQLQDTSGWNLKRFKTLDLSEDYITKIQYRPFDQRYIYYENKALKRDRSTVFKHFFNKKNIGLVLIRKSRSPLEWNFSFISQNIINEGTTITSLDNNYIFPLYIYQENGNGDSNGNGFLFKENGKRDNFTKEFREFIKTKYFLNKKTDTKEVSALKKEIKANENNIEELKTVISQTDIKAVKESIQLSIEEIQSQLENQKANLKHLENTKTAQKTAFKASPEKVLGYVYAILHSPTYRKKYAEFLKFDFPRIPFIEDLTAFRNLSALGWDLMQAHLQNKIPQGKTYDNLARLDVIGDNLLEKPVYRDQKLFINKTQYFSNIPAEVYEFKIGAYQVLHKYLKDRKGRILSLDDINNIENISKILKFTILQMKKIDKQTKDWV